MPNYFTNENPNTVTNTTGVFGIVPGGIDTTAIADGITDRGSGLVKLGSSMPSPFARLFLFSAALREVNAIESNHQGQGHIGVVDQKSNKLAPTPYHELVGELLDMLEFVFTYGDDANFHVVSWAEGDECSALDNSANSSHQTLSKALRSAFTVGALQGHTIYLFKWGNTIIGGTSPISLVYTSANLQATLGNISTPFVGAAGNRLFTYSATPLHQRSEAFRDYLYRLYYNHLGNVAHDNALAHLATYILDSAAHYDAALQGMVQVAPQAYTNVKALQTQGLPVTVAGIDLMMFDHTIVINKNTTDYLLAPTSQAYTNGAASTPCPLVLTKYGVQGLIYAGGRQWMSNSDTIPAAPGKDIAKRVLPGFPGTVYPYLTVGDFLEEKVIEVSYAIDNDHFVTGSNDVMRFLLPLRRRFFDYFTTADIDQMLTVTHDDNSEKLTVRLRLPLVNGHEIELYKQYDVSDDSAEKVSLYEGSNTFDLAFFPFYRLQPATQDNVYNVLLGHTAKNIELTFYESAGGTTPPQVVNAPATARTQETSIRTTHLRVGAFTFAEIGLNGCQALLIPRFTIINSNATQSTNTFSFAIDFGTTNTHVAYTAVQGAAGSNVKKPEPLAFSYGADDSQLVTLHGKDGPADFGAFTTAVRRELVPETLGAGATVAFPLRTATYQVSGKPTKLTLFGNTNIGFNYSADISQPEQYVTNIKWDRQDILAKDRMSAFFVQILWMMKNKSVLNDGSTTFSCIVTYPFSMRRNDLANFKSAWDEAKKNVHCNVEIKYCTESIAPYYAYLAQLGYGVPYVNIDIGGGTTDFLYVDPATKESHVFSAFFAANDLWNDGIATNNAYTPGNPQQQNGFITVYKKKFLDGQLALKGVEEIINNAASSADAINYLFVNDTTTRFSDTISANNTMLQLPIIHFSAIVFYLAYALDKADVNIPATISFTGMGSKYIRLISASDADIATLVTEIFHYAGVTFGNDALSDAQITITFADNPKEVTAIGALKSTYAAQPLQPDEDTYLGYSTEDPGRTRHYNDITQPVRSEVLALFNTFTKLFQQQALMDSISQMGHTIQREVISKLQSYAPTSFAAAHAASKQGQQDTDIFNEPMFFWPLKEALYVIGKDLAQQC